MVTQIFGWLGTFFTLYSFTLNDVMKLRLVNSIGSVLWIVYGIQTHTTPTIVVNGCVLIIHSVWFVKNKRAIKFK